MRRSIMPEKNMLTFEELNITQSQIQDFPKGAAPFVSSAKSTRFSGGVVAEFFRGSQKQTQFSGGG